MTSPFDGYGNLVTRDTSAVVGGRAGYVNTCYTVKTIGGKANASFEWSHLALLDNYADGGENCSRYAKSIRYGKGGTWGDCIEVQDETTNPGPVVALELDMFVQGPDTGSRVALDIVVGDSSFDNGGAKQTAIASFGIRIGAYLANAWAKFQTAIFVKDFLGTGIQIGDDATVAEKGVVIRGKFVTGVDMGGAAVDYLYTTNSMGKVFVRGEKVGNIVAGFRCTCDGTEYVIPLCAMKP